MNKLRSDGALSAEDFIYPIYTVEIEYSRHSRYRAILLTIKDLYCMRYIGYSRQSIINDKKLIIQTDTGMTIRKSLPQFR